MIIEIVMSFNWMVRLWKKECHFPGELVTAKATGYCKTNVVWNNNCIWIGCVYLPCKTHVSAIVMNPDFQGIMDLRIGLLFLLALGAAGSIAARQMAATEIFSTTAETYEISVEIMENQEQEKEIQTTNNVTRKDEVCTLCEEFASQALDYLAENKTQTEILEKLHRSCSQLTTFEQECITLVDYYSSIFFSYISSVHSEDFCRKFNLCQEMKIFSAKHNDDSCSICQRAVSEVLVKLKDPDTKLEIIELLLKACNSMEKYAYKCKRMVFEYGPVILTSAEQFLETTDLCTMLHACEVPEDSIEQASKVLKADS